MSLLTHLLSCLFGLGSWVSINGLWVELPLIVPQIPEGWFLPSYLSVLIQMANVGPLFVTLMHRFKPGVLNEAAVVYVIIALGTVASVLLGFFWKETVVVAGAPRSVALLVLTFFLATVDCTSSVTFLPFMMRLQPQYLTSYFIGEGVSGLLPAMVALIQGVGVVHCINTTQSMNQTSNITSNITSNTTSNLQAQYQPANFSPEEFFFFLSAMMLVCLVAFILLNYHPSVARENPNSRYTNGVKQKAQGGRKWAEQKPMIELYSQKKPRSSFGSGSYSWLQVSYIFVVLGWANALTNVVLPSVQSYSCLPYGNDAYHLSASLAAVSNPLACFIAMFFPIRSVSAADGSSDGPRFCCRGLHNEHGGAESVSSAGPPLYGSGRHCVVLGAVRPHPVLREGDDRTHPEGRRPRRPRLLWSGGAARLPAGRRHHVSPGQRPRLLLFGRSLQHKVSLNAPPSVERVHLKQEGVGVRPLYCFHVL